jgi:hypothetical protein
VRANHCVNAPTSPVRTSPVAARAFASALAVRGAVSQPQAGFVSDRSGFAGLRSAAAKTDSQRCTRRCSRTRRGVHHLQ